MLPLTRPINLTLGDELFSPVRGLRRNFFLGRFPTERGHFVVTSLTRSHTAGIHRGDGHGISRKMEHPSRFLSRTLSPCSLAILKQLDERALVPGGFP